MRGWEIVKSLCRELDSFFEKLGPILIPAAITLVGYWYTSAIAERSIQAKFVELGVSILQAQPGDTTPALRTWGIQVLNKYSGSGIQLTDQAKKDLIKMSLPQQVMSYADLPFRVNCACDNQKTYCFINKSDYITRFDQQCKAVYIDEGKFDISDGEEWKWSSVEKCWVANACIVQRHRLILGEWYESI